MYPGDKITNVASCLQLAILLEISAHKPGNVSVVTDFENTRFEHFLASVVAARPSFETAARRGVMISRRKISVSEAAVGKIIRKCVSDIDSWQSGGNTLLGTVILLSPIAVAAGMAAREDGLDIFDLRRNLKLVVGSTTPEDAVNVYKAMAVAKPSGLGESPSLDVNDPESIRKIRENEVSLFDVFKIAQEYDMICSEWVNNFPITFTRAYPSLSGHVKSEWNLNDAIIETFLEVLSEYPDTFIARKAGIKKAREVSVESKKILKLGGTRTRDGRNKLRIFDLKLRRSGNLLNPGTTADILSAALALLILEGYRP
jgi:triphosphoribosyl-dephospho-CoA synthase